MLREQTGRKETGLGQAIDVQKTREVDLPKKGEGERDLLTGGGTSGEYLSGLLGTGGGRFGRKKRRGRGIEEANAKNFR